jgi:hypothetical protein
MKKIIFAGALFFLLAPVTQAVNDLGSLNESVGIGKTISIGLNPSATGQWYNNGNTNPNVASAKISSGNLIISAISQGVTTITTCTDTQSAHCLTITVTVGGSVLGETVSAHQPGSWVLDHGTVYYISANGVVPITTWKIFLSNGGKQSSIQIANQADLNLPLLGFMVSHDSRVK